jgi:predicted RNase H-like nuclease (RuvC/YqgF family)
MLRHEKDRLERQICALDRRKNALKRQFDSNSARIEKLQAEVDHQQPIKVCKSQPAGSFKKVAIDY